MSRFKVNLVMANDIITLSEFKSRHKRLKRFVSNWYNVVLICVTLFTVKIAAEQLVLIIIRGSR